MLILSPASCADEMVDYLSLSRDAFDSYVLMEFFDEMDEHGSEHNYLIHLFFSCFLHSVYYMVIIIIFRQI